MQGQINNISIKGIQVVVPQKTINNIDFSDILGERRCKKQIRLTGVKKRHISPKEQSSVDLAYEAGKKVLDTLEWRKEEINVLVFITQNPVFEIPSSAFYLQKMLDFNKECIAFDINLGCSGAVVGIQVVASLLQSIGNGSKGLLLISDPVYAPDESEDTADDLAHQMLFGSAGSAVAMQYDEKNQEKMSFLTCSDGNRYKAILRRRGQKFEMNGESVFEFGVNDVVADMIKFRNYFRLKEENIDYYSFHQAQDLMLNTIDSECNISMDKDLRSLSDYGNTNGSSVLVNLCANHDKFKEKEIYNLVLCGFGVGLSWAYINFYIKSSAIFPVFYSDACYGEV